MKANAYTIVTMAVGGLVLSVTYANAGGLGIALDGFLQTLVTFAIGLGVVIFSLGGASWAYNYLTSPHTPLLSGSLNLMVGGGLLGGIPIIATQLGLISGALL